MAPIMMEPLPPIIAASPISWLSLPIPFMAAMFSMLYGIGKIKSLHCKLKNPAEIGTCQNCTASPLTRNITLCANQRKSTGCLVAEQVLVWDTTQRTYDGFKMAGVDNKTGLAWPTVDWWSDWVTVSLGNPCWFRANEKNKTLVGVRLQDETKECIKWKAVNRGDGFVIPWCQKARKKEEGWTLELVIGDGSGEDLLKEADLRRRRVQSGEDDDDDNGDDDGEDADIPIEGDEKYNKALWQNETMLIARQLGIL